MRIVSACLLGIRCRYDAKRKPNKKILILLKNEVLIPVCPEQLGGLKTPRTGSGIRGGDGHDVLGGKAKVINRKEEDWSSNYLQGAKEALKIAKYYRIKEAIFKQGSPACGCGEAFQWKKRDGKWSNRRRKGDGVTTALFKKHGIKVLTERQI